MKNVVIVDSNDNIREGLKILLEYSTRYNCVGTYKTPDEFSREFPGLKFDIILIEIDYPDRAGIKTIRLVNESELRASIIPLTILEENERILEAICSGAHGYLLKITPAEQIIKYLDDIAQRRSHMSTYLAKSIYSVISKSDSNVKKLSEIERDILKVLAGANSIVAAADKLGQDINVIKRHMYEIYGKLQYFC